MRQFILREESNAKALYAYLKANWRAMAANDTPFVAIIEEYKAKRHNQQNRLYWSYLKQIATQAMVEGKQYSDDCWQMRVYEPIPIKNITILTRDVTA